MFGRKPGPPRGLLEPGNVDLHARPIVHNADGSISTVLSGSFGTDRGEVLVPLVSDDGRILTEQEAERQYFETGRHLGIFDTPDHATRYAERLHNDQAKEYGAAPMGLLAYADRYLPDEQIAGLLSGARRRLHGLLGPADEESFVEPDGGTRLGVSVRRAAGLPEQDPGEPFGGPAMVAAGTLPADAPRRGRADKATDGKPGFWATVDQVLGGRTITDAREYLRKQELARRDEPAAAAMQDRLLAYISTLSPREQALYLTKPETWASSAAKEFEPRTVSEGATEVRPNGSVFTAPKLGMSGDQGYTQTPDAFTVTGRRDPSFSEQSEADKRIADMLDNIAKLDELIRHNQATEGIGRDANAVRWAQHRARLGAGGYGTPGVGGVGGMDGLSDDQLLDAIASMGGQ